MESNLEDTRPPPREFPLELLQRITNNFSKDHIIGRGGFGVVYKGVLDNGEEIALKKLNHIGLDIKNYTNEFNNIIRAHHQNIVQFVGYCYHEQEKWIMLDSGQYVSALVVEGILCFEYLHGGNLESHLSDEQPCKPDWQTCYKIIKGVCQGLNYLHNGQKDSIYHLDLKPANILLDNNMLPKIGDFGISRIFLSTKTITTATRMMGTLGYMPPEYVNKQEISPKYDVFSLGAIIMQIMAGQQSYYRSASVPSKETIELVWGKWRRIHPTMSSHTWHKVKTCIGIALRCLEDDRQKRPTIGEIVEELNRIDINKLSLTPKATNLQSLEDLAYDYYENLGWIVIMVGWAGFATISRLLAKGFDYLDYDTTKKLAQLEPKILVLERVVQVVKTKPYRPRLEKLFKELKYAYYEAEEILDAVEYHCLERQIQDGKLQSSMDKFWSSMENFFSLKSEENVISKELIKSLNKMEDIINEAYRILDSLNLSRISNDNRRQTMFANPTTTAVSQRKVFGRDNDRDKIIAMLHENEGDHPSTSSSLCFSVIGIHGLSGSGKSTLAQYVCDREGQDKLDNKEGHFDLVMWVHVSQNFSVGDIFKELYEAASEPKITCPQFNNLNALQEELERKLDGKRFLVVLDDVWCNKYVGDQNLPELLSPLKVGKRGSKILVTTRSKYTLSDLCAGVRYTAMAISEVNDTAFFELFMHYALGEGQDQSMLLEQWEIGVEIVKKLNRSPLAARTVGENLRRHQDVNYWRRVRERDDFKGLMGSLWWSYNQLEEQTRRCFAYCSIFPRRHRLYRDDLVRLWMAEGFIRTTYEGGDIEEVAQEIFSDLLSMSFLQPGGQDNHGKEYYLVHDLLRDLAEAVAGSDCFRIDNNTSQNGGGWTGDVPQDVRHLFVQSYDATLITEKILELRKLHTLIIYSVGGDTPVEEIVIKKILKSLLKLRVLAIASSLEEDAFIQKPDTFSVPESVGQLKHLSYLAFRTDRKCRVTLPNSLNQLYQMQVLDFGKCNGLVFSCGDLINLRHVCSGRRLQFSNISRLVSLQTIPAFRVSAEQGHEAKQLRYLNGLSGELYIFGLESVESREEALEFDLAAKKRLTELTLGFTGSSKVESEVLEGLCPPVGLEKLTIGSYEGSVYPNWMVGRQNGGPEKLQELFLLCWRQPGPAPELVEAFIYLRQLFLWDCSWNALPGNMEHLSSLEKLRIQNCLNVRSLPALPQSLKHFTLCDCNDGFMESCKTDGHPNWQKLQHVPRKHIGGFPFE